MNIVVNIMHSIISTAPKMQDDNIMEIIKMLVPGDFFSGVFVAAINRE